MGEWEEIRKLKDESFLWPSAVPPRGNAAWIQNVFSIPGVGKKKLMLTYKPVVFLHDPALPIQDKSCCDKTPAAVFIFVFMVGLLYAGDKLVEVNGVPVEGLEPEQVINILVFNIFKICFLLCTLRLFVCSLFSTLLYMRKPEIFNRKFIWAPYCEWSSQLLMKSEDMKPELNLTSVLDRN